MFATGMNVVADAGSVWALADDVIGFMYEMRPGYSIVEADGRSGRLRMTRRFTNIFKRLEEKL